MENVKALKRFGQNFLKNKLVLERIASLVNVTDKDLIIEIGPGMGALTEYLSKKDSYLLCYEIDERMKEHLAKYQNDKTTVIFDDFMKRNILEDINKFDCENLYVVANIPYYITSPIILKLIESPVKFKKVVLLVQKEFAERLVANHGNKEYNAFTLFVDYFYEVKINSIVSRNDFVPAPKVESAVIELLEKDDIKISREKEYFVFIREAFKNKRKTLKNNLKNYDWTKIPEILRTLGYNENIRAEEISKENFKILWEKYIEKSI